MRLSPPTTVLQGDPLQLTAKLERAESARVMWVRAPNTILAVDNGVFLPDPRLQVQYDRARGHYMLIINVCVGLIVRLIYHTSRVRKQHTRAHKRGRVVKCDAIDYVFSVLTHACTRVNSVAARRPPPIARTLPHSRITQRPVWQISLEGWFSVKVGGQQCSNLS
jgi:hypothetical protein